MTYPVGYRTGVETFRDEQRDNIKNASEVVKAGRGHVETLEQAFEGVLEVAGVNQRPDFGREVRDTT